MIKLKTFIFPVILIAILYGCSTVNVVKLQDVKEIKGTPVVYSLPKNILRVKFQLVRTAHHCGPYNRFAKKYLGIDNRFTENTTIWKISDIKIDPYTVPDTNNTFVVLSNNPAKTASIYLSSDGILLSVNKPAEKLVTKNQEVILNLSHEDLPMTVFTDISLKKLQVNRVDTVYKKVRSDNGFIKVPEVNSKIVNKNLEEKAEEIANQIFDIREEKINILTGDYKSTINGEAIKSIIDELNKIESKYTSLFTTVTKRDTIFYSFEYCPENVKQNNGVLCYFSESKGISSKKEADNIPVVIDVVKNGSSNTIAGIIDSKTKKKPEKHGLFYRVPENADVKILLNNDIIAVKKVLISQFGTIMSLPANLLNDKKSLIEFYEDYGSVKTNKR